MPPKKKGKKAAFIGPRTEKGQKRFERKQKRKGNKSKGTPKNVNRKNWVKRSNPFPNEGPSISTRRQDDTRTGRFARKDSYRISAMEDFWLNVPAGTYTSGQVIINNKIGIPAMGPWIKNQGNLWSKYRVDNLRMQFRSAQGSTQTGTFIHFFDPDPDFDYTTLSSTTTAIQRAYTMNGRKDFAAWETSTVSLPNIRPKVDLWVQPQGSDMRLSSPGQYVLMCVVGTTASADLGALHITASIDFKSKTDNAAGVTEVAMYCNVTSCPAYDGNGALGYMFGLGLPGSVGTTWPRMQATHAIWQGMEAGFNPDQTAEGHKNAAFPTTIVDQTKPSWATQTIADILGTLAFPVGEYLMVNNCESAVSLDSTGTFIWPVCSPDVIIHDIDTGSTYETGSGNSNGFSNTTWFEVKPDANQAAYRLDMPDTRYNTASGGPDADPYTYASEQDSGWGLIDTVINWAASGLTGQIANAALNVMEIVGELLPLFLLMKAPRMRQRILLNHPKYRGKLKGLQHFDPVMGPEDRLLFKQFLQFKLNYEANLQEEQKKEQKKNRARVTIEEPSSARSTQSTPEYVSLVKDSPNYQEQKQQQLVCRSKGWLG